jgi:D-tagatose-1,6-bisphosphate aldolase subunit GatZ/KbaZ
MTDIDQIIKVLIARKESGLKPITLLAVCPNSTAVLEAAVRAAARNQCPMLFAATLNQVDYEASYTGWTPAEFVSQMQAYADKYHWNGPLYACLDHGGPWLKDLHTLAKLSYVETMQKVKNSITACVEAGYSLLHIDPTVDRTLATGETLPLRLVVERTVELMAHAEQIRIAGNKPKIAYEVGTEEVHGGLVDLERFKGYISLLKVELHAQNLTQCWPSLFVAQIGTHLHTTNFKPEVARDLYSILAPIGSLAKGHYTDWVKNPEDYPVNGMGAANVGPEFTAEEYMALAELEDKEHTLLPISKVRWSNFMVTLQKVVIDSGRWKKWLLPEEQNLPFDELKTSRKDWLLKTGSRYIWTHEEVVSARTCLYQNLRDNRLDPNNYVVEKITQVIERYIKAFNLQNSLLTLGE